MSLAKMLARSFGHMGAVLFADGAGSGAAAVDET